MNVNYFFKGAGTSAEEEVANCGRLLLRRKRSGRDQTNGGQSRCIQEHERLPVVTPAPSRLTHEPLSYADEPTWRMLKRQSCFCVNTTQNNESRAAGRHVFLTAVIPQPADVQAFV